MIQLFFLARRENNPAHPDHPKNPGKKSWQQVPPRGKLWMFPWVDDLGCGIRRI